MSHLHCKVRVALSSSIASKVHISIANIKSSFVLLSLLCTGVCGLVTQPVWTSAVGGRMRLQFDEDTGKPDAISRG